MLLALDQARRASGRVHPNPPVGAVVYRGNKVLGAGYTCPPPGPHAEIVALRRAVRRYGQGAVRGASLAVTLEPCCHIGRTGPCTEALIKAGIKQVVCGHSDPHPEVAGSGFRRLRANGVGVTVGVLKSECLRQHKGFISRVKCNRPYISLKIAATLDGRIATGLGESQWITGDKSRRRVHELRARTDALIIGSATVDRDDPQLTARRGNRVIHRPVRIIVDSELVVPIGRKLFNVDDVDRTWILMAARTPVKRKKAFERMGVRLLGVPRRGRHLDLDLAVQRLAEEGLTDVLVEGGGGLSAALLRRGLVDEVHWFVNPSFLGGDAVAALQNLDIADLANRLKLKVVDLESLGEDLYVRCLVQEKSS